MELPAAQRRPLCLELSDRGKVHSVGAKYFSGDEAPYQDFVLRDTGSHGEVCFL